MGPKYVYTHILQKNFSNFSGAYACQPICMDSSINMTMLELITMKKITLIIYQEINFDALKV